MKKYLLQTVCILFAALLLLTGCYYWFLTPLWSQIVHADKEPMLDASEAILMDNDTGAILFAKNENVQVPIASTTKIMTALVAMKKGDLDQMVTVGQDAIDQNLIGSSAYLHKGESIKLRDLLYGLLLNSGDDAAVAIADSVAISDERYVDMMNEEAQELHLSQTHFVTVSGLDTTLSGNPLTGNQPYSTASDLLTLTRYAMSIPLFAHIVSQKNYEIAETTTHTAHSWKNSNGLLWSYQGMLGIKTGWTGAAGGCLVFAATRQGHTLIGVVLHSVGKASQQLRDNQVAERQALDEQTREADAISLLNWGFVQPLEKKKK
ncbi:D-alanyl-D-alanine carboxypeptidase family protein [Ktedonospora formicarum]|uniref:Peptidase S11 D-alanyl-D-alanine carboxypeptidase A N-terminal domain-containing protein n=1 Tax=Ktedonospora formicarum TaxID=2778364 RepID=A0A8J3IBU8_9CHLR|nr:D-alanyl-D-alanine carboxypeptidase family protein [Ktedonospora formicarum]GHO51113.1 hypothetical protein KSX_92760 [Ktedonospora formicarum]